MRPSTHIRSVFERQHIRDRRIWRRGFLWGAAFVLLMSHGTLWLAKALMG